MVEKTSLLAVRFCLAASLAASVFAFQDAAQSDNTKVNKRDGKPAERTADQGSNAGSDRETMRKIRRSVVADKSLSTYAHNIKIISEHGKVTLKGPVHTEDEKKKIEAEAAEGVGASNITNEITVKGSSK